MKKLGFIGFGNMASAIAGGIVKSNIIPTSNVFVYDINENATTHATSLGFNASSSESDVIMQSDYVFLCVKPQHFTELYSKITCDLSSKIFISIAAGVTISSIKENLNANSVIRAMPNTPLLLGCGSTALTKCSATKSVDFNFVKQIFESVGTVYEVPEEKFNEIINVNGSTPAYIYYFSKIIIDYAIEHGISPDIALNMFCDTLKGSAEMLAKTDKTPQELIEMVSSKGGTTVAAVTTFNETGFKESLVAGLDACLKRAKELSEN